VLHRNAKEGILMVINNRSAVAASVATILVLVGCSSPDRPTSSGTTQTQSASPSSRVTTTSSAPASSDSRRSGKADGLQITIYPQEDTTVRPGGPPLRFGITLLNTTANDIAQVGLVVSLGHCSCGSPEQHMMPQGSMRMLDPHNNTWVAAPYVREGGGMDFILQTLVPPFDLKHGGQVVTYELEMQLDATQDFTVGKGDGAINVTRTDIATHNSIGTSPTASLRITVEP
jgi:hypothetical protein